MDRKTLAVDASRDGPVASGTLRVSTTRVAIVTAACVALISLLALAGWFLHRPVLYRILPNRPAMVPMTSILCLILAVGLVLIDRSHRRWRGAGLGMFWAALVTGTGVLASYAWAFAEPALRRSSPQTAVVVMLLAACGLARTERQPVGSFYPGQFAGVLAIFTTLAALSGHIFGVLPMYGISPLIGMAIPTCAAFLFLAAGILYQHSDAGFVRAIVSPGIAGAFLRRLLAGVLLAPFGLALLLHAGQELGFYDMRLSAALRVLAIAIALTLLTWFTGRKLAQMEAAQQRETRERLRSEARLEAEQRAGLLKDELMAVVSHELRTPLTNIILQAELIKLRPDAVPRAVEAILRSVDAQVRVVDELLDSARVHSASPFLHRERLDLKALVNEVVEQAFPRATAKGIELRARLEPATAEVDPARMRQVLENLLDNALKFTPPDGRVEVDLACSDGMAELAISDTGRGVSPDFLPDLFVAFRQEDAVSKREHGGLGLGLHLVKLLVEAHGGQVQAESPGRGHGLRVLVKLPLSADPAS